MRTEDDLNLLHEHKPCKFKETLLKAKLHQQGMDFLAVQQLRRGVQCGKAGLKCTETFRVSRSSMMGLKLTHLGTLY